MKRTFVIASTFALFAAVSLSSPVARAQIAAPPAPDTKATPAPAPAAPVTVTPEMRAAIKELMDITKTRDNLAKTFQAMGQSLPPQIAQAMNRAIENNPTLTPEQKQKVRAGMNQPFEAAVKEGMTIVTDPKVIDESLEKMYPIYAQYFTLSDIRGMVAFYKTPLGVKVLTNLPLVLTASMQAGVSVFEPRIAALMDRTLRAQVDAAKK